MWRYSDNEAIREQIDHTLKKEEELSLFMRLWKRNFGFLTLVISFFLMMEKLNPDQVRLKNEDAIVQNINWDPWVDNNHYNWDHITVAATGELLPYFKYQPILVPSYPHQSEANYITAPPNWKVLYPQTSVTVLSLNCSGLICYNYL
ncbi:MAG: hypothetical protein AAF927_08680 [Bacteroidota bacterium]